jgi:hypothetical protein
MMMKITVADALRIEHLGQRLDHDPAISPETMAPKYRAHAADDHDGEDGDDACPCPICGLTW